MKLLTVAIVLALGAQAGNDAGRRTPLPLALRVGVLRPGGGYTVTIMAIDPYVARVLAGEAVRDSQPAALEALAIAIRTFALANRGRHRADGFDVCDQTHCQVVRAAVPATERAAQATSGRVLMRAGIPAQIFFSASCGGRTEVPSEVWPGAEDPPYLPSRKDEACGGSPEWTADIDSRDLMRALRSSGFRGELRDVRIAARNRSGRVARLKLQGLRPDEISGQDLRVAVGRTLGWQHVKSTAFELRRQGAIYRFAGHGSGHGVGMCVIGSARLAERGASPETILAHYFPGLAIQSTFDAYPTGTRSSSGADPADPPSRSGAHPADTRSPSGAHPADTRSASGAHPADTRSASGAHPADTRSRSGAHPADTRSRSGAHPVGTRSPAGETVSVSLPDDDEGQRDTIERQTVRARDELAAALGVPPPPTVTLRFHPTTDDYEHATGQAWFTSATVVGHELHLLPLAVLRDRGVLDRTLRHGLVHMMTDDVLAKRPRWVREGAAIYFAGEQVIPGETIQRPAFKPPPRLACPDDNELLRPVSVGALSNAYARARACFARQIQSGRKWSEVR